MYSFASLAIHVFKADIYIIINNKIFSGGWVVAVDYTVRSTKQPAVKKFLQFRKRQALNLL